MTTIPLVPPAGVGSTASTAESIGCRPVAVLQFPAPVLPGPKARIEKAPPQEGLQALVFAYFELREEPDTVTPARLSSMMTRLMMSPPRSITLDSMRILLYSITET